MKLTRTDCTGTAKSNRTGIVLHRSTPAGRALVRKLPNAPAVRNASAVASVQSGGAFWVTVDSVTPLAEYRFPGIIGSRSGSPLGSRVNTPMVEFAPAPPAADVVAAAAPDGVAAADGGAFVGC